MATATLTRRIAFSAAHRYHRPDWSEAENRRVFGACTNPVGHGHNYLLDVAVSGTIDPVTGFSVDLSALDALLEREIKGRLDHQHINHAVPEFQDGGLIPTCENLLAWMWPILEAGLPAGARLVRLRLREDRDLWVDFHGK